MLLPIGHSDFAVRRLPWVTFSIMGICLAIFIGGLVFGDSAPRPEDEALRDFAEYFWEHPYVEVNDEQRETLMRLFQALGLHRDFDVVIEVRREGTEPPADALELRRQQTEFDRLFEVATTTRVAAAKEFKLGLVPAHLRLHSIVTYQFVHGGFWHLFGNMLFLYLAGPFIEDRWGRGVFIAFYLVGGAVAGLAFAFRYPDLEVQLVGASGAIAAVMGAFLVRFWNTKITFFYWFFMVFYGTFQAPAWLMLPLWFVRELFTAQAMDVVNPGAGGGGVAYWAHVWGFGFGAMVAVAMHYWRIEDRFLRRAIADKAEPTLVDNAAVARALDDAARGGVDRAVTALRQELQAHPENLDAAAALWRLEVGRGHAADAVPIMLAALRRAVRIGDDSFVIAQWAEVWHDAPDLIELDAALALRIAEILKREADRAGARDVLDRAMVSPTRVEPPPGLLVRLAKLGDELGASRTGVLAAAALSLPDLPEHLRSEIATYRTLTVVAEDPPEESSKAAKRLKPIAVVTPTHTLQLMEAVPVRFDGDSLVIRIDGTERTMGLHQVEAVAVAGLREPDCRPFLVIDLLLDGPWSNRPDLRVVRLRSSAFDPRGVVGGDDGLHAFRSLAGRILDITEAVPLPDPEAARGRPFRTFSSLAEYQREVLGVGR